MNSITEQIKEVRRIAIISETSVSAANDRINHLYASGIRAFEIVFRTTAAGDILAHIAGVKPENAIIGAGTVLTADNARLAIMLGARFIISPGFSQAVYKTCEDAGALYIPGAATPTEIMSAQSLGLKTLKLFPAELLGGTAYLNSLAPVFPDISFIPTGGINTKNAEAYLALKNVIAVGGSNL